MWSRKTDLVAGPIRRQLWAWVALGVAVALLGVGWLWLPVGEWVEQFQRWILGLGFRGVVIFAGAFIVATLVLAPDWPLAVAAGMVYGLWAIPLVLTVAIVAASLAFLAARHLARRRVRAMLSTRPKFAAIDRAVAAEGWKIVLLLRLSPLVPFNVQNYLYGITAIPFLHYVAASFFGIVPGTALFVYLGALGTTSGGPLQWIFSGLGLLATAAVVVIVTRKARAQLAEIGVSALR
jgi:uncharacterized membrane protein YdjX (TVP38/TMEM64 family)